MFQAPTTTHHPVTTNEHVPDDDPPPPQRYYPSYHEEFPAKKSFLDELSKTTLVLIFMAFIFGLMLGKSMTPIVLKGV